MSLDYGSCRIPSSIPTRLQAEVPHSVLSIYSYHEGLT